MNKTKKEILGKIKREEIKMKPEWEFKVERTEIRVFWVLLMVAGAVAWSMLALFLMVYNPIELRQYGEIGWGLLINDFPYLWLIIAIGLVAGGALIFSRIGENYKKSTRRIFVITMLLIVVVTILMVATRKLFNF